MTGGLLLFLLSIKAEDQFLTMPAGECLIDFFFVCFFVKLAFKADSRSLLSQKARASYKLVMLIWHSPVQSV